LRSASPVLFNPTFHHQLRVTTRRTVRIIAESGEEVQPENIHHFADFCGRVSLPPGNVATMKRLSNSLDRAGLVVHGFRPMKFLPTTNLMSRDVLAVANDSRVRGSCRALYNLKRSMKRKGVFAVGELLLRATATSRMVALVPREDDSDWFVVTQLPYREDVRDVPVGDVGSADRDSVDAAQRLIAKCAIRLDGGDFASCLPENPYLKHFFGYLESVSLGRELGRVDDDARMDVHHMTENASEEIESFTRSLPEDEQPVKDERKRKAAPPSSKDRDLKKESIGQEWIDMYKNDEIADLKNNELKAFLKTRGERLSGKKSDLIDRVHRCIEKELFKE
jgi:ATP-dependent DNA helicase 2 subunit 1